MRTGLAAPFGGRGHERLRAQLRRRAADPLADLAKAVPAEITLELLDRLYAAREACGNRGRPIFSEWEQGFIPDIHEQFSRKSFLSPKQEVVVKRLILKANL